MKRLLKFLTVALVGVLAVMVTTASADMPSKPFLSTEIAETIAKACHKYGLEKGWKLNIAVLDESGLLTYFVRDPMAFRGSVDVAINKAWTSAQFPFPTRFLGEKIVNRDPQKVHGIQFMDRIIIFPGGLPIMAGESHIGAIGVSGASADQDEECAQAGIDAAKVMLQ